MLIKNFLKTLVRFYQKTMSPDHGWLKVFYPVGYCKFQPSCSQYAYEAIDRYGALQGTWLGIKRIFRCNPWSGGGEDPVK